MPKLLIHEGGQQSVFELFEDETSIGRGAVNAVQVVDGHASKHHAVIRRIGGRLKLVDLESKNGTRVNGEFKNQRWLAHGDVVSIGAMVMTYDGSDVAAAAPAPAAVEALVSGPALVAAPEAAAPAPVVARPRRPRRDRDDGDGEREERRGRVPARRSSNSAAVGMLIGVGVIGLIAILILLLKGGAGQNALALQQAKIIYKSPADLETALAYLKANADPSDRDGYVSVARLIGEWEGILASRAIAEKEEKAKVVMKRIMFDRIEQHINHLTDEQLGQRCLQFLEEFKDTPTAMELLNSPYSDYPKLRALMEKAKAAGAPR